MVKKVAVQQVTGSETMRVSGDGDSLVTVKKPAVKKAAVKKAVAKEPEIDHGSGRAIVYPTLGVSLYKKDNPKGPLTVKVMKELLGWEEEPAAEDEKFGDDFDLRDNYQTKIRLKNNIKNRPLELSRCKTWEADILHGNWCVNGETFILGRTGIVLDGQHRGVGLVLAAQEWETNKEAWPHWTEAPWIETFVVSGIDESSKVVDTINTGAPRTLADVIFRDDQYFDGIGSGERKKIAKVAEHAIRMLAHRTAAFADAFNTNQTHSSMIEFLHRHKKLLDCIRLIWDAENDEGSISKVVPLGAASALMFLMGCSGDDGKNYAESPSDKSVKWGHWDLACKFWEAMGNGAQSLFPIKSAIAAIGENSERGASRDERIGVLTKAWALYSVGKMFAAADLSLSYNEDGEGTKILDKSKLPFVGVIDKGGLKKDNRLPDEEEAPANTEAAPAKPREKRVVENPKPLAVGDECWVKCDPVEASWYGRITELHIKTAKVLVGRGFAGTGRSEIVSVNQLQRDDPFEE